MPPKQFREILVFVAGSTPQIITETIQALITQSPAIIPDRICIITTGPSKRLIHDSLIVKGRLAALCAEYEVQKLTINDNDFMVILDTEGREVNDLWTIEENEFAADQIAAFLRELAADPFSRMHCSLAGGRKTMSYFMGLAFQLVARQWDRLYHIMVNPEFEKNPNFYYQPRINSVITSSMPDGTTKELNTNDAQVNLIELPLIYLRDKLTLGSSRMREMVAEGQRTIDCSSVQLPVTVNLSERTLYIDATLIELPPTQLTIYTAFLRLKSTSCKLVNRVFCQECISCFVPLIDIAEQPFIESMSEDYQQIYGGDLLKKEELLEKWLDKLDCDSLRQQISKINRTIKEELQDEVLHPFYLISCNRKYAGSRYGIRVEKGKINLVQSDGVGNG